jgi:hypothetical protein
MVEKNIDEQGNRLPWRDKIIKPSKPAKQQQRDYQQSGSNKPNTCRNSIDNREPNTAESSTQKQETSRSSKPASTIGKTISQELQRRLACNHHQLPPGLEEVEKNRDQKQRPQAEADTSNAKTEENQQLLPKQQHIAAKETQQLLPE